MIGVGMGGGWGSRIGRARAEVFTPVDHIVVSPSTASVGAASTQQLTVAVYDAGGGILTGRTVTWESANEAVATVDSNGLVTGVGAGGPINITATCEGQTDTCAITVTSGDTPFASDDFESGDFAGATNINWYTHTTYCTISTANPRTGTYSLRVHYPAEHGTSEMRGSFAAAGAKSEVWWEWYLHIPANYVHRQASPDNNKFWILGYDDNLHGGWQGDPGGWTFRMEMALPTIPAEGRISRTKVDYGNETSVNSSWNANGTGPAISTYQDLIRTEDLNTWVQFRVHIKLATNIAAADGEFHFWKNGTLVKSATGLPLGGTDSTNPADCFEMMGTSNTGFAEDTTFYIDDVKFYSSNPGW